MTRSQHAQRHWRRKVLGVGLTASLLLVGPTAVWADGDEHLEQPEEISEPVTDLELSDGETGPAEGPTGDVPAEPGDDAIARGEDAQQNENPMPRKPPTAVKDPTANLRTVNDVPSATKEPAWFPWQRVADSRSAVNPVPSME